MAALVSALPGLVPAGPVSAGDESWLDVLNAYRASAALPAVSDMPWLTEGERLHSRYIMKTGTLTHAEDPSSQWYTSEGDAAGRSGNVAERSGATATPKAFVEGWLVAPFHALGMLDPRLAGSAFGSYEETSGGLSRAAATLDVLRGRSASAPSGVYPVVWPASGSGVPLTSYLGGESPDPLAACPGYGTPAGLPIIVQFAAAPKITVHSLAADGAPAEHCLLTPDGYTGPDAAQTSLGRQVLASRNAVVMLPRSPLVAGTRYAVLVESDGTVAASAFTITDGAVTPAVVPAGEAPTVPPHASAATSPPRRPATPRPTASPAARPKAPVNAQTAQTPQPAARVPDAISRVAPPAVTVRAPAMRLPPRRAVPAVAVVLFVGACAAQTGAARRRRRAHARELQ